MSRAAGNGINRRLTASPLYTLDTNAIIYYLGRDPQAVRVLRDLFNPSCPLYVSTIAVVELYSRPGMSRAEKDGIERLLDSLIVMPIEMELARAAGELRSQYRLKTPDSVIAATALYTRTALVTRNTADFQRIKALRLIEL